MGDNIDRKVHLIGMGGWDEARHKALAAEVERDVDAGGVQKLARGMLEAYTRLRQLRLRSSVI